MILQELDAYYRRLLEDSDRDVPMKYWSTEKAAWEFEIDSEGRLLGVLPLTSGNEKKQRQFILLSVPEHDSRTSGKKPFFLCDNASYLLGLDEKDGAEKFALSSEFHHEVLSGCDDPAAKAVLSFFGRGSENLATLDEGVKEELRKGSFAVFRLQGDSCRVQERSAVSDAWWRFRSADDPESDAVRCQCAVTGEYAPAARLFPQVTGIPGAQSAGASLVSFNQKSFESYGKEATYNASLSEDVAFNAGSALKYLYSDPAHSIRFDQTTILFWADRPAFREEELVSFFLEGNAPLQAESGKDTQRIGKALDSMRQGMPIEGCDPETRFFLLGITPNAARLAVQFFEVATFGALMEHYRQFLDDTAMADVKPVPLFTLLKQTSSPGKEAKIPRPLINPCMHALITGQRFPRSLFTLLLSRMRADNGCVNKWDIGQRTALMKACLLREGRVRRVNNPAAKKEGSFQVALDKNNSDAAYSLGRLFAILERAQMEAIKGLNATIKDRYFSAAASTPARVFPTLIGKSENHFAVLRKEKPGLCIFLEKQIDEIYEVAAFDDRFPKTLSADEQGGFYIGYQQQRADLWSKHEKDTIVEKIDVVVED